jgi:hypothetical protein
MHLGVNRYESMGDKNGGEALASLEHIVNGSIMICKHMILVPTVHSIIDPSDPQEPNNSQTAWLSRILETPPHIAVRVQTSVRIRVPLLYTLNNLPAVTPNHLQTQFNADLHHTRSHNPVIELNRSQVQGPRRAHMVQDHSLRHIIARPNALNIPNTQWQISL